MRYEVNRAALDSEGFFWAAFPDCAAQEIFMQRRDIKAAGAPASARNAASIHDLVPLGSGKHAG